MIGTGYENLENLTDAIHFQKEPSESSWLLINYDRMALHAFMEWMYFTFLLEEAMKVASAEHMAIQFSALGFRNEVSTVRKKELRDTSRRAPL